MVLLLGELLFGLGKVSLLWGSIDVQITINPGFVPWAMQKCRPYRAPLRLPYLFITLMCLSCLSFMQIGYTLAGQMKCLRSHRSEIKIGTREQISSAYFDLLQFILGYLWLRDSHGKTNMPLADPPPKAPISWLPATLQ